MNTLGWSSHRAQHLDVLHRAGVGQADEAGRAEAGAGDDGDLAVVDQPIAQLDVVSLQRAACAQGVIAPPTELQRIIRPSTG
jgi:hypothetical protein